MQRFVAVLIAAAGWANVDFISPLIPFVSKEGMATYCIMIAVMYHDLRKD